MENTSDWRGTPCVVGSLVLYPVSQGSSSAYVRVGHVLEFVEKEARYLFGDRPKTEWQVRIEVTETMAFRDLPSRPTLVFLDRVTVLS